LADETIYQRDLAARLKAAGFTLQREVPITVSFRTFVKTYHLLMDPNTAFRLTALNDGASRYEPQLKRLLDHSPLKAIHWINIGREHVTFTTIRGNSQR
jgi:hypothetical protein